MFTYTINASVFGALGSYLVQIQGVRVNNQSYPLAQNVTFGIELQERTYENSWSYGAIRQASVGVNTGLIAYLKAETNGGLELKLRESDPNRTDDDVVEMNQKYSAELGSEIGVGIRRSISAAVSFDASLTTERSVRTFGSLKARFQQPYADADRKAQGIFLGLSIIDSVSKSGPMQPLLVSMLQKAEARLPYLNYIKEQSSGMGAKVTPLQANVGIKANLAVQRGGQGSRKGAELGLTLLDVGSSRLVTSVLTDRGDEYSASFDEELAIDLTLLSPSIPFIKNRLIGLLGNQANKMGKEYVFDSATNRLKRIELTLSSEGNPSIYTDVTKKKLTVKITIHRATRRHTLLDNLHGCTGRHDDNYRDWLDPSHGRPVRRCCRRYGYSNCSRQQIRRGRDL